MEEYQYESSLSAGAITAIIICSLAFAVLIIAAQWRVFQKAGQPGWAAIIPIYNYYIMTKVAGKPGWWTILMLLVPIVFLVWVYNMISKSFGKDEGFTVGLVLLKFIFWPILGFGSSKYQGPYGKRNG